MDSTSGWKSSLGKIYKHNSARARTSTLNSARVTAQRRQTLCQLETEVIQRPRICKEAATKYYNHTANETDEESGNTDCRRFSKIRSIEFATKPKRGKFTVKMIFFETTIGSNNYTICKIDTWSIFPTDWRQPMRLFTVLQQALFHNEQFRTPIMCDMWGSVTFCEQNPYWTKLSV